MVIHTALPALSAPLMTQRKHATHVSVRPSTSHHSIGPTPSLKSSERIKTSLTKKELAL